MFTLALLLTQAFPTLTLAQVRELPPTEVAAAVLGGRQHGPIETFEVSNPRMGPPGVSKGQLVERPVASDRGCTRKRWTVTFAAAPGTDPIKGRVQGIHSTQEIALSSTGVCSTGRYVHLNPNVSLDQGWAALAHLEKIRAGTGRIELKCSDTTFSGLCIGDNAVRATLRMITPWAVSRDAGDLLIWLGTPGHVVTEVRFNPASPHKVIIARSITAPF